MCDKNDSNQSCLANVLEVILSLQQRSEVCDDDVGCSRPFLGSTIATCLNTRPITLYSCCNNTLWTMPYVLNDTTGTSTVFRIENLDDNCATFRILAPNPDTTDTTPYLATNSFFTIKLSCVGIIKCLGDTNVAGL